MNPQDTESLLVMIEYLNPGVSYGSVVLKASVTMLALGKLLIYTLQAAFLIHQ